MNEINILQKQFFFLIGKFSRFVNLQRAKGHHSLNCEMLEGRRIDWILCNFNISMDIWAIIVWKKVP